jgi:hypothetical protein
MRRRKICPCDEIGLKLLGMLRGSQLLQPNSAMYGHASKGSHHFILDTAGSEGGHGAAKSNHIINRYTFNL